MEVIQHTTLNFIYVKNEEENLSKFFDSVQLVLAKREFKFVSNSVSFDIKLEENHIHYKENLVLKTKNNTEISMDYPIYAYKTNNIYIDFDEEDIQHNENSKLVSLEIIYQSTDEKLLPQNISYDGKKLIRFDTFGNNLRKRIGLMNINPKKLELINDILSKYPHFKFEQDNCYIVIVRIPANKDIQYSIADLEMINTKGLVMNELIKKEHHVNKDLILNSLELFKKEFFPLLNQKDNDEIRTIIDDLYNKYSYLKSMVIPYYDNVLSFANFQETDIKIFEQNFYFLELVRIKMLINSEEDYDNELTEILFYAKKFNTKYNTYISEISKLNIDIIDKLLLIKCYNKLFLDSIMSKAELNFMNTLVEENINENNSYKKAKNFVKEIISNLNEDSRLFEIFLYLDSNAIENLLEKNEVFSENFKDNYGRKKTIEYKKHPTEYGTNMSTVDEVKNHLCKLLPKYIVRTNTDMKFNASYDDKSKIMIINEKKLFNSDSVVLTALFENIKYNERYVLPISIEILHELCDHGKKRLINEHEGSAEEYRDSKCDYKRCNVLKKVDDQKEIKYPESGVVLENYISRNKKIIRWLKKVQRKTEEIKKVIDFKLWIDKDFTSLENMITDFINLSDEPINVNNSQYSIYINRNDEDIFISDDDDTCGFHKY